MNIITAEIAMNQRFGPLPMGAVAIQLNPPNPQSIPGDLCTKAWNESKTLWVATS